MPPIPDRQPSQGRPRGLGSLIATPAPVQWRRITVSIVVEDEETGRKRGVGTIVDSLGDLAVHRAIVSRESNDYCITHTLTGLLVAHVATEHDARKIATYLHNNATEVFSQEDVEGVREILPGWVREWVLACRKARAYVSPEPFRG